MDNFETKLDEKTKMIDSLKKSPTKLGGNIDKKLAKIAAAKGKSKATIKGQKARAAAREARGELRPLVETVAPKLTNMLDDYINFLRNQKSDRDKILDEYNTLTKSAEEVFLLLRRLEEVDPEAAKVGQFVEALLEMEQMEVDFDSYWNGTIARLLSESIQALVEEQNMLRAKVIEAMATLKPEAVDEQIASEFEEIVTRSQHNKLEEGHTERYKEELNAEIERAQTEGVNLGDLFVDFVADDDPATPPIQLVTDSLALASEMDSQVKELQGLPAFEDGATLGIDLVQFGADIKELKRLCEDWLKDGNSAQVKAKLMAQISVRLANLTKNLASIAKWVADKAKASGEALGDIAGGAGGITAGAHSVVNAAKIVGTAQRGKAVLDSDLPSDIKGELGGRMARKGAREGLMVAGGVTGVVGAATGAGAVVGLGIALAVTASRMPKLACKIQKEGIKTIGKPSEARKNLADRIVGEFVNSKEDAAMKSDLLRMLGSKKSKVRGLLASGGNRPNPMVHHNGKPIEQDTQDLLSFYVAIMNGDPDYEVVLPDPVRQAMLVGASDSVNIQTDSEKATVLLKELVIEKLKT
jgi:hypothetical protein